MIELLNRIRNERGQGMAEYALILVLVSILVISALSAVGTSIENVFNQISQELRAPR
jgi:pilus assembly protein Flp/PilA